MTSPRPRVSGIARSDIPSEMKMGGAGGPGRPFPDGQALTCASSAVAVVQTMERSNSCASFLSRTIDETGETKRPYHSAMVGPIEPGA